MSEDKRLGWHFLRADRRLGYGDGREVVDGETLSYTDPTVPTCCRSGMHASPEIWQALNYAPGAVLCRVEVWGDVHSQKDKFTGRHRQVIFSLPEKTTLSLIVKFAGWCANRVNHHAAHAAHARYAARTAAAHAAGAAGAAATAATTAHAATAARAAHDAAYDAAYAVAYAAYAAAGATHIAADDAYYTAVDAERRAQSQWWADELTALGMKI